MSYAKLFLLSLKRDGFKDVRHLDFESGLHLLLVDLLRVQNNFLEPNLFFSLLVSSWKSALINAHLFGQGKSHLQALLIVFFCQDLLDLFLDVISLQGLNMLFVETKESGLFLHEPLDELFVWHYFVLRPRIIFNIKQWEVSVQILDVLKTLSVLHTLLRWRPTRRWLPVSQSFNLRFSKFPLPDVDVLLDAKISLLLCK